MNHEKKKLKIKIKPSGYRATIISSLFYVFPVIPTVKKVSRLTP